MNLIWLGLAIVCNVVANAIFKVAADLPVWTTQKLALFGLGLAIGLVNTLCYIKALEEYALSFAFPIFIGGSVVLITAVSATVFQEGLSFQRAAGIAAICGGLALLWKS